jgi:cysteine desulfurase
MNSLIYLDNASTTSVDKKVLKTMLPFFNQKYGNTSSSHTLGLESKKAIDKSRRIIAKSINANPKEIIFTSGGTESNNIAIKSIISILKQNPNKNHIITTKIEHDSILNSCKYLEKEHNIKITYLNVDKQGFINLQELKNSITPKTALVSIIHGNNEIGTIQDLKEIGKICKEKNILFHTDACQSYTKTKINVEKQNLSLVTLNSHKIHGPKGVGAMYLKKEVKNNLNINPLFHGGNQESKIRSGTENIPGIVGFAKSVELANLEHAEKIYKLKQELEKELEKIPEIKINSPKQETSKEKKLCNIININFKDINAESVASYLDAHKIEISIGSACSSNTKETSHVLKAIGLSQKQIKNSIRISLSRFTTKEEINHFINTIKKIINTL